MSADEFREIRKNVLGTRKTGAAVPSTDVGKNHQVPAKNMHYVLKRALAKKAHPLLQPRTGVARTCDEISLLRYLRDHGLDISSIQLDSASRNNMYKRAEEGVLRSEVGKQSFLSGYPIPVHGVQGVADIVSAIETPFQVRAGSPDHLLTDEISLAGGTTSLEGGLLCYLYPYDKRTSPVPNLRYWKYVDRLTGMYQRDSGIVINREFFDPLTTTLIEPTIPISINSQASHFQRFADAIEATYQSPDLIRMSVRTAK